MEPLNFLGNLARQADDDVALLSASTFRSQLDRDVPTTERLGRPSPSQHYV